MSAKFRVSIATDVAPSIEAWRDRFVSTVGIARYRRAAGWAVDEVAKHAVLGTGRSSTSTSSRTHRGSRPRSITGA